MLELGSIIDIQPITMDLYRVHVAPQRSPGSLVVAFPLRRSHTRDDSIRALGVCFGRWTHKHSGTMFHSQPSTFLFVTVCGGSHSLDYPHDCSQSLYPLSNGWYDICYFQKQHQQRRSLSIFCDHVAYTEANRPRRYLFIVVLILTLTEYVVQIGAVIYYDVFGDDAMCSHVGDDQHMVWSYFDVEGQHLVFGLVTWPAYFLPIVMTFWFRPLWIVLPLIIYSLVSATSLNVYFNLSSAWAPMWCWANFVNALWFLTVPRIARKVKADLEEPESKWRWLFHGTDELKLRDRDQVEIDGTVTEAGNRML